jgi:hypothetical protein
MSFAPYVVFRDQTGALSLHAACAKDVQWLGSVRRVSGRACQYGLQIPLNLLSAHNDRRRALTLSGGWGDGGASAAMEVASQGLAVGEMLYDIHVDLNTMIVLGVWRQECVVVNARVSPAAWQSTHQVVQSLEHG